MSDSLRWKIARDPSEASVNLAESIVRNVDGVYQKPLIEEAKKYLRLVKQPGGELEKNEAAEAIWEELDAHQRWANAFVRVLDKYKKTFDEAAKAHWQLSLDE